MGKTTPTAEKQEDLKVCMRKAIKHSEKMRLQLSVKKTMVLSTGKTAKLTTDGVKRKSDGQLLPTIINF